MTYSHDTNILFKKLFGRVESSTITVTGMGKCCIAIEHLQIVVNLKVAFAAECLEHFDCLVTTSTEQVLIISRPLQVVNDALVCNGLLLNHFVK